jgi:hypothetical protein
MVQGEGDKGRAVRSCGVVEGEFFGFQMPTDGGSGDSGEGEWIQVAAQRSSQSLRPEQQAQLPSPIAEEFAGLFYESGPISSQ